MHANPTNSSISKLPVRRNVAPIFRRTRKLEDLLDQTLKLSSDKIYRKFSSDNIAVTDTETTQHPPTNVAHSKEKTEIVTRKNWKAMVSITWKVCNLIEIIIINTVLLYLVGRAG